MFTLDTNNFRKALASLERVRLGLEKDLIKDKGATLSDANKEKMRRLLTQLNAQVSGLQCVVTSKTVQRCIAELDGAGFTGAKVQQHFDRISLNLQDEIGASTVVVLDARFAPYYAPASPLFGDDVFKRFPSIGDEISESGRCLAFGCGTAAAFHLMRVMEVGLRAIGRSLDIKDGKNWGDYIIKVNSKIADNKKTKPRGWTKDELFYEEIIGDLTAVKTAWRNPTIHTIKPFDQSQAELLFTSVRSFMQRIAARVDEKGRRAKSA